jgi:hypothetical protein
MNEHMATEWFYGYVKLLIETMDMRPIEKSMSLLSEAFQDAKKMEQQRIENAYDEGEHNADCYDGCKQYFNKTYKGDEQ